MDSQSGELQYVSDGSVGCALYLLGTPDQVVELTFENFDVQCETGGLLAVSGDNVCASSHVSLCPIYTIHTLTFKTMVNRCHLYNQVFGLNLLL